MLVETSVQHVGVEVEVVLCEEAYWDHPSCFCVLESSQLLVRYAGSEVQRVETVCRQ